MTSERRKCTSRLVCLGVHKKTVCHTYKSTHEDRRGGEALLNEMRELEKEKEESIKSSGHDSRGCAIGPSTYFHKDNKA